MIARTAAASLILVTSPVNNPPEHHVIERLPVAVYDIGVVQDIKVSENIGPAPDELDVSTRTLGIVVGLGLLAYIGYEIKDWRRRKSERSNE